MQGPKLDRSRRFTHNLLVLASYCQTVREVFRLLIEIVPEGRLDNTFVVVYSTGHGSSKLLNAVTPASEEGPSRCSRDGWRYVVVRSEVHSVRNSP